LSTYYVIWAQNVSRVVPHSTDCHLLGPIRPYIGIVTTTVVRVAATSEVEAVYREDGARLWRAL